MYKNFNIYKTPTENNYIIQADEKYLSIIVDAAWVANSIEEISLEDSASLVTAKLRSDASLYPIIEKYFNDYIIKNTRSVIDTVCWHQVFLDKETFLLNIDVNWEIIPINSNDLVKKLKEESKILKKLQIDFEESNDNFYSLWDRVLVYWPTGTGKTHSFLSTVNDMVSKWNLDWFEVVTITDWFEDTDFFEYIIIDNWWVTKKEREIVQLLRDAAAGRRVAICFDELNRWSSSFMNLVLKMLDSVHWTHYEVYYAGKDEKILIPVENILFYSTMNLGGKYTGTNSLDEALFDRFNIVLHQSYNTQFEKELADKAFGSYANDVIEIVEATRKLNISWEIRAPLSTRWLKAWAEKFINTPMEKKDVLWCFNIVAISRLCTVDDFGNPNDSEKMLILSKFKELGYIS